MFLELLDIENFIKNNNILEVKNGKYPSQKGFDEDGLWSETIFGKVGTRNRKQQFGYIDLKNTFIHPIVFRLLKSTSTQVSKILRDKGKYIVKNKMLIEDNSGETGILFLIREFKNIDFRLFSHSDKKQECEFIENSKNIVLINKFLVTPAGDRDININDISKTAEINELYRSLIFQCSSISGLEDIDKLIVTNVQNQLVKIADFIRDRYLKGKSGLIRNNMMKKSMDFSSRMVLSSSPQVPLGSLSMPWHTALTVFEPIVSYNLFRKENDILPDIKEFCQKEDFDTHDLIKFLDDLVKNPSNISPSLKNKLFNLAVKVTKDQVIICKRDPVLQRNSWFSAHPLINDGRVAIVNSLDLPNIGGDCRTGNILTFNKSESGEFIQNIESIDDFHKNHNLTFIENRNVNNVEIYDYLVNDEVYSIGADEESGAFKYSKIQKWSVHKNLDLVKMIIDNSKIIISKSNSCYAFNKITKSYDKIGVSEVESNKENLFFVKIKKLKTHTKEISEFVPFLKNTEITESEAGWFFGMWLGDGHISLSSHNKSLVALSKKSEVLGNNWCDIAENFTQTTSRGRLSFREGYTPSENSLVQHQNVEKSSRVWSFYNKLVRDFIFDNFGSKSSNKKLPNWILKTSDEFIKGLMAGIIDSDGHIDSKRFDLYSNSKFLIHQLYDVLKVRFGLSPVKKIKKKILNNNIKEYDYLSINISENDFDFWGSLLNAVLSHKHQNLEYILNNIKSSKKAKYYPTDIDYKFTFKSYGCKTHFDKTSTSSSIINFNKFSHLIKSPIEYNLLLNQDLKNIELIPATKVKFENYESNETITINIHDITITTTKDNIAYDLTMEDTNVRSFLGAEMIVNPNCDGDTVAIVPVFTEEAKKEALMNMNPMHTKSKMLDPKSYSNMLYVPTLDAISTIYKATKNYD